MTYSDIELSIGNEVIFSSAGTYAISCLNEKGCFEAEVIINCWYPVTDLSLKYGVYYAASDECEYDESDIADIAIFTDFSEDIIEGIDEPDADNASFVIERI